MIITKDFPSSTYKDLDVPYINKITILISETISAIPVTYYSENEKASLMSLKRACEMLIEEIER